VETEHAVHVGDARRVVPDLEPDSVDLVVTSPPYPMVEMWDDAFRAQDAAVGDALDANDGDRAFRLMHDLLDEVWAALPTVVRPGGLVVVNVGAATRSLSSFRQYPNPAEITDRLTGHGFEMLPGILWRKPTNSAAKFMGSGMRPPNAYVTLEHEQLLVFRNGGLRGPDPERRDESAYFWEERNEWFSDLWELRGERQALSGVAREARERSGAFPLELPLRLVRMFSVRGDTVLDPFWGTGTTSLAALIAGRDSVGVERDPDLARAFEERVSEAPALSERLVAERLDRHREFVADRRADGDEPGYDAEHYDFPVVTRQERGIRLYETTTVDRVGDDPRRYRGHHDPV
jgi:DNA modification methylase